MMSGLVSEVETNWISRIIWRNLSMTWVTSGESTVLADVKYIQLSLWISF